MFLRKFYQTSNASRNHWKFTSKWFIKHTHSRLAFRKFSKAGTNNTGQKVLWTKGSLLKKIKLPLISYNFRSTYPLLLTTFKLVPFSNKLLALLFLPSGGFAYFPTSATHSLFTPLYFRTPSSPFWISKQYSIVTLVALVRQYKKVSNFELWPGLGIQYARSAGTFGKITNKNFQTHNAIVYLPSGVRKIISLFSAILPGRNALTQKKFLSNTRSGYWRSFGCKPIVRGVAMNPVDHPHGGRTKAIKYPRTPWGKTTKFK